MKAAIIFLLLAVIFICGFLLHFDTRSVGPKTTGEVDDLQIQRAYFDSENNALFLVIEGKWAKISLGDPQQPIFLHWKDFSAGYLPDTLLKTFVPIAVQTRWTIPFNPTEMDRRAAHLPSGFVGALYMAPAQKAADNYNWFKAYTFVGSSESISFLFDPDSTTSINIRGPNPATIFVYGPSYVALCIALPLAFSNLGEMTSVALFVLSFVLHVCSSLIIWTFVGIGKAWGGGAAGNFPGEYFASGCLVLFILFCVRCLRLCPCKNKPSSEALPSERLT